MPLAVAALPVLIVAIVAMIILWGLAMLLKAVFQSLANHVPVIGGAISRSIGAMIDTAIQIGSAGARAVIADAVGFILAPVYWIEHHIASVLNFFSNIVAAIRYITTTLIPDEVAALEKDISTAYHNAVIYTQAVENALVKDLTRDVAALDTLITTAESALERYAQSLFAAAEAYTAAAITATDHFIITTATELESEIAQVAAAESAYARALYTDAITYTQTLVTAAETTLATDVTHVVDWTQTQVTALDAAIAAMGTQVIALTLDAVGTVEADLRNLKSECTDNLCSGLSGLADLFNSLVDTAAIAALAGYAAWMGTEPRAAGHATADVLAPVATAAAGAARDVIGAL